MQRFSMLAAPKRSNDSGMDENNVFESDGTRMLKTKGIYGLNASGKSNMVKAFAALISMVSKSVVDENITKRTWDDRFKLLTNWDEQPMYFQLIFKNADNIYRYGFQIKSGLIFAEWLFVRNDQKEVMLFSHTKESGVIVGEEFHGAKEFVTLSVTGNHEIFRADSLFLTGAALMGNIQATEVRMAIIKFYLMNGINDKWSQDFTKGVLQNGNDSGLNILTELMKAAETGTVQLTLSDEEAGSKENETKQDLSSKRIMSGKVRYDEQGNFVDNVEDYLHKWESAGTQKWLYTSTVILSALLDGKTLIIDEFDARFHPNLTLKIVNIFNNPETNPYNAQLIFATHDTGLLRRAKLRRDQICFVDKDKYGVSSIKTLIEYKGVRKDESYEKEYLEGSYGAVAYLDDIDNIISDFLKAANE